MPGQLGEQDADGQVQPGPGGAAAHEVGELAGEAALTSASGQALGSVIRTCFPKISSSRAARAAGSMYQVSRWSLGVSPASCQAMTRRAQASCRILVISASTFWLGRRVLPRARVEASSSSLRPALAKV